MIWNDICDNEKPSLLSSFFVSLVPMLKGIKFPIQFAGGKFFQVFTKSGHPIRWGIWLESLHCQRKAELIRAEPDPWALIVDSHRQTIEEHLVGSYSPHWQDVGIHVSIVPRGHDWQAKDEDAHDEVPEVKDGQGDEESGEGSGLSISSQANHCHHVAHASNGRDGQQQDPFHNKGEAGKRRKKESESLLLFLFKEQQAWLLRQKNLHFPIIGHFYEVLGGVRVKSDIRCGWIVGHYCTWVVMKEKKEENCD